GARSCRLDAQSIFKLFNVCPGRCDSHLLPSESHRMTSTASRPEIRLTHIITGLEVGGAETMLSKLVSKQDRERFELEVICLQPNGPIGERIAAMGIPVRSLE